MVTSKDTLKRVQEAIFRHHNNLKRKILGTTAEDSLLRLAYLHSFLTRPESESPPKTIEESESVLRANTDLIPTGDSTQFSLEATDSEVDSLISGLESKVSTAVSSLIRENNAKYHRNSLENPNRTAMQDELIKESTLGELGEKIDEFTHKAEQQWRRIVLTELSDVVGRASVDRIVDDHLKSEGKVNTSEVLVFRIIVGDSATCPWCRKFYGDVGQVPKIYRLSTLLANGSNYGLLKSSWLPVVGATHPNTRTSQIIEIPPGYIVLPGGSMEFVGRESSRKWISENLST